MEQNPEWTFLKVHITLNKKIGLEKNPLRAKKLSGSKSGISRRKIKYSYIFLNSQFSFLYGSVKNG